jgi:hypothetical protein
MELDLFPLLLCSALQPAGGEQCTFCNPTRNHDGYLLKGVKDPVVLQTAPAVEP